MSCLFAVPSYYKNFKRISQNRFPITNSKKTWKSGKRRKIPNTNAVEKNLIKTVFWSLKKIDNSKSVATVDWASFNGTTVNGIIRVMESNWTRFTSPRITLSYPLYVSTSFANCYHSVWVWAKLILLSGIYCT